MGKLSNLEFFRRVADAGEAPAEGSRFIYPPMIAKTLGFRLIEVGPGTATMELMADTEIHANPMGTIHGGVLCDIADAAIGTAHASGLKEDESFTSIDLQINFFRPVWNGRIRAVAKPVNVGRQISRYVCDILRDDDKLVAQVSSTVMTLRGGQASGR
ncbi:MAG TPA: PaaI family thioesterase [Pyrinomonadaceae bacterium]|nr:PaaI family thioesterase [Pyrinomonadaceae bacterium]